MSTNTLPDYAGQNQSFDSSDAVLQHIDSLLSLVLTFHSTSKREV
jgi:hypothetical protein